MWDGGTSNIWYNMSSWVCFRLKNPLLHASFTCLLHRQSVCLGAQPRNPQPIFLFPNWTNCCYSPYVTSSLMRGRICRLQLLPALTSTVILGSESHRTHDRILLSQTRDSPNLESQVPIFISLRSRVAQLYLHVQGSISVASYKSQGYGGGIRTLLHKG
jgi:hypothetical protein